MVRSIEIMRPVEGTEVAGVKKVLIVLIHSHEHTCVRQVFIEFTSIDDCREA
jgi:hypothetical protein